jgi:hypothetical protein
VHAHAHDTHAHTDTDTRPVPVRRRDDHAESDDANDDDEALPTKELYEQAFSCLSEEAFERARAQGAGRVLPRPPPHPIPIPIPNPNHNPNPNLDPNPNPSREHELTELASASTAHTVPISLSLSLSLHAIRALFSLSVRSSVRCVLCVVQARVLPAAGAVQGSSQATRSSHASPASRVVPCGGVPRQRSAWVIHRTDRPMNVRRLSRRELPRTLRRM